MHYITLREFIDRQFNGNISAFDRFLNNYYTVNGIDKKSSRRKVRIWLQKDAIVKVINSEMISILVEV